MHSPRLAKPATSHNSQSQRQTKKVKVLTVVPLRILSELGILHTILSWRLSCPLLGKNLAQVSEFPETVFKLITLIRTQIKAL